MSRPEYEPDRSNPIESVMSPHVFVEDIDDPGLCFCGLERFTGIHISDDGNLETASYRSTRLSLVTPEKVDWLWQGRIPLGKITLLDGDPGVGKSTLATTMAAHVTTGTRWPDRTPCPTGSVLMLSGEDGLADTVRPRFDATGIGDPDKFHVLDAVFDRDSDDPLTGRDPDLGAMSAIGTAVMDHDVKLLIVDVLMAFLPSEVDSHKDQHVRTVLRRLSILAEGTKCAVLMLRHLNKTAGGNALYRGGGSIGIVGAARAGFLAGRDPDDPSLIVLASTKTNLAAEPPSLSYRLVDHEGTGKVQWEGRVERKASDLLSEADETDHDQRDALTVFLIDYLTDQGGKVRAVDAKGAVEKAFGAVPHGTLVRARKRAGIRSRKASMRQGWLWELEMKWELDL